jgi:hypothetical protein
MLKNYLSKSPLSNIFGDIEKTLVEHGAKQVSRDYDNGKIIAISFIINTKSGDLKVKLPARFEQVEKIFINNGLRYKPDQPYRTAWATLRDWISAQMALLDLEMVKMEEIFLPYVTDPNGRTFFEFSQERGFKLPAAK